MGKTMTIGKLASAVGISVETIRFYQRQGLVAQPEKPLNGFRQYEFDTIERLKFIINAKSLGFTLNEIRTLDNLSSGCKLFNDLANSKLESIKNEIAHLHRIEQNIKNLIDSCSSDCNADNCSIAAKMYS
ncbi:MAG: MerR family transcriptional regulator [Colwellia sp.]|nr:MerR family transcriptional regulator [Colwellia sp.]